MGRDSSRLQYEQIVNTQSPNISILPLHQWKTIQLGTDISEIHIVGKYLLNSLSHFLPCVIGTNLDINGNACRCDSLFSKNAVGKIKTSTPESGSSISEPFYLKPTGTLTGTVKLLPRSQQPRKQLLYFVGNLGCRIINRNHDLVRPSCGRSSIGQQSHEQGTVGT